MDGIRNATRRGAAVGVAVLLALSGAGAADAGPGDRRLPAPGRDAEAVDDEAGPMFGAVDARYATPGAAKDTLHREHAHSAGAPTPDGADAPSVASATPTDEPVTAAAALDPAVYGSWTSASYRMPVRAIHATLLRNGKVLLIAGSGNQAEEFAQGDFQAAVLNPATGAFTRIDPPYDMFCAGHAQLPNGNILVVGGTTAYASSTKEWGGSPRIYEFDVVNERWIARPRMVRGRWYPTSIQAPSGNVWNVAGDEEDSRRNTRVEKYSVNTGAVSQMPAWSLPKYPGLFWTAKDQVFFSGARYSGTAAPGLYSPATGAVKAVPGVTALDRRRSAAAVLTGNAADQRVLVLGGGWPATNSTSVIDLKPTSPVGVAGPALRTAKGYVSAVNLPNGQVFETGGGTGRNTPVYESSIISAARSVRWHRTPCPAPTTPSAMLLPDGRVMTLGGDPTDASFELRVEIFSPPYLFKGTRPTISAAPTTAAYGGSYSLSATAASGSTLASAWLVRPASTTHSTDPNQRAVRLGFTATTGGARVTMPNKFVAAPGYYMLVVNDSQGRPSRARWVKLS